MTIDRVLVRLQEEMAKEWGKLAGWDFESPYDFRRINAVSRAQLIAQLVKMNLWHPGTNQVESPPIVCP